MPRSSHRMQAATLLAACALALLPVSSPAQATEGSELERSLAPEVAAYVEADRAAPAAPCQVLFVGSSSIRYWAPTLARDMAPLPVIDRGFGGSHIASVNHWFSELVSSHYPRSIVFYAGENDLDAGASPATVVANFDRFMKIKVRKLNVTPVYFISLKPSPSRWAQRAQQSAVNDAIRERARHRDDLHYVDVVPAMLQDGKPRAIFREDGLHMTDEGYRAWTAILKPMLEANANAENASCARLLRDEGLPPVAASP